MIKFGEKEQESNERLFGFQVQGTIRSKSKEEAEAILYNILIAKVEGISQLIIR